MYVLYNIPYGTLHCIVSYCTHSLSSKLSLNLSTSIDFFQSTYKLVVYFCTIRFFCKGIYCFILDVRFTYLFAISLRVLSRLDQSGYATYLHLRKTQQIQNTKYKTWTEVLTSSWIRLLTFVLLLFIYLFFFFHHQSFTDIVYLFVYLLIIYSIVECRVTARSRGRWLGSEGTYVQSYVTWSSA